MAWFPCNLNSNLGAKLLWTNSSPTSNFSAQKISLDFSSYDAAIVVTSQTTVYIRKTDSFPFGMGAKFNSTSELWGYSRNINSFDDNGISFSDGCAGAGGANWCVIPQKIYGIKSDLLP